MGTSRRGGVRDHAVRPHRSVPASARHALRRVRDQRVDAPDRHARGPTAHDPRTAALRRSRRARGGVHPRRPPEPRRGRRTDDRHLGERSRRRQGLRLRPLRDDGHDARSQLVDRLPAHRHLAVPGRAVRRRRAPDPALDRVPPHARRSSRALGSVAQRRARPAGDLRRSRRDDQRAPRRPQPEGAGRARSGRRPAVLDPEHARRVRRGRAARGARLLRDLAGRGRS